MKSKNKKTFVIREGGGKYSLLTAACLLALASIANGQDIVSYEQSIDDKLYGIAFDSSVGNATISGKNEYTSGDVFNISGDISGNAEGYVGIGNYYSLGYKDLNKIAKSTIEIGDGSDNFLIDTKVSSPYDVGLYGILITGKQFKLSDNNLKTYKTKLTVNVNDFTVSQRCEGCMIVGIASAGYGAYIDSKVDEVSLIDINADGVINIESVATTASDQNTFAIENNSTGTISLSGKKINLFTANYGGSLSSLSYVSGINHFMGTTELIANDPDDTGVTITSYGENRFYIVGVDLQSKAVGQVAEPGKYSSTDVDDPLRQERVIIKSESNITIDSQATNGSDNVSVVMGVLARHYSWLGDDLQKNAYGSYELKALKNIFIQSLSNGISANKLAGIVIDVNEELVNGQDNKNIFEGKKVDILVAGTKAANNLNNHYQDIWGDSDASVVDLLNGTISITGNDSVRLSVNVEESADRVRGLVSAAKTVDATDIGPDNSPFYQYINSKGQGLLYLSEGKSKSTITSHGTIAIGASAGRANEVQGVLWRSSGLNYLEANDLNVIATVGGAKTDSLRVAGLDLQKGPTELVASNAYIAGELNSNNGAVSKGSVYGIALSGEETSLNGPMGVLTVAALARNDQQALASVTAVHGADTASLNVEAATEAAFVAQTEGTGAVTGIDWQSSEVGTVNSSGNITVLASSIGDEVSRETVAGISVVSGAVNLLTQRRIAVSAGGLQRTGDVYGIRASNAFSNPSSAPNVSLDGDWLNIGAVADPDGRSIAVAADESGSVNLEASSNAQVGASDFAFLATQAGNVKLAASNSSDSEITGDIVATGANSKVNLSTGAASEVSGDILAATGGTIEVTLGEGSRLTGLADNFEDYIAPAGAGTDRAALLKAESDLTHIDKANSVGTGSIRLDLGKSSLWNVTGNSWLNSLTAQNSTVDVSFASKNDIYHRVTTQKLSGQNNTFALSVDLANESARNILTDQVVITDGSTETASHKVSIKLIGNEPAKEKLHSVNWLISQTNASAENLTFEPASTVAYNGSTESWQLKFLSADEVASIDSVDWETKTGSNAVNDGSGSGASGNWYLVRIPSDSGDPDNPGKPDKPEKPDTPETDTIKNLGTLLAHYLAWRSDLSDLRKRLGEVRYGAQEGAWAKVIYDRERASGLVGQGYKAETYGVHIGTDRFVKNNENGSWLAGGSLKFARADQEHLADANNGTGVLDQYSAKLYATYASRSGAYADFVLSGGYYEQELEGRSNQADRTVKGDYSTFGFGISAEVGHMLSFDEDVDDRQWYNHWFLEPQLQLAYYWLNGKDFKTSTGMRVSQDDLHALTGRAGAVLGKKWNYGGENDLDRRFLQFALRAGLIHEFLGQQDVTLNDNYTFRGELGGTTFYYGITGDWAFSPVQKVYFTLERETGSNYRRDLGLRFGYRYEF